MRRALLVGINDYPRNPLRGCINDANRMQEVFATHENGNPNFSCKLLTSDNIEVTGGYLRKSIEELFNHRDNDTTLLYFSGHGATTKAGTYLVSQDGKPDDYGVSLMEIVALANNSEAKEVIIILDCCHAGGNNIDLGERKVVLREGVSILAASTGKQYSYEKNGSGVFTSIIYDAMLGSAADLRGKINLSSLYYFADTQLDAWQQRPVFKSHVSQMISLRDCKPKVPSDVLRKLPNYFNNTKTGLQLSINYLPSENGNSELQNMMEDLHLYHINGLIQLPESKTLETAAQKNEACTLTPLGNYYKKLALSKKI
ncbi:caspase family protein [Tenacibaculum agarivorans]|uniref:caspase family protein n=1 Tax=Tenacibaculum agarivorans TaxID=1908389 RepID=UPI00094BA958|nr:caspase family protein [Tenacibaculum agarivorans]